MGYNKKEDIMDHGVLLKQGTGEFELLKFTMGNENYAVNVSKVREIIRADYHVTPVPNSDDRVIGIFQPRDEVITAIDLGKCLFGRDNTSKDLLTKGSLTEDERGIVRNRYFIVCSFNHLTQAWLVDDVKDILRLPWSDIISPTDCVGADESFITGIYKGDDSLVQIVDFEAIMVGLNPDSGLTSKDVDKIPEEVILNTRDKNISVYVADDSKMLNKLITNAVEKAGYKVTSFPDGQKLLDSLISIRDNEHTLPDIVITDIEMPVLDGMTLCRKIKEDEKLKGIPVFIFSSLIDDAMKMKCESVHADMAFSKPEIGKVIEYIRTVLAGEE